METSFSIIVPAFNEEKLIGRALMSVKAQSYRGPYEVIVVDGCSKDRTVEIAKKYAENVIVTQKLGAARQRNLGAKKAKGDILIFLDADTTLPKNHLQRVAEHFKSKRPAMVVGKFVPDETNVKAKFTGWLWSDFLPTVSVAFHKPGYGGPASFAVDRKVFEAVGGFNENLSVLEDWEFCIRVSKAGKIICDRSLRPMTSMRRFERNGYLREYAYWTKQYFAFAFMGRPLAKSYNRVG